LHGKSKLAYSLVHFCHPHFYHDVFIKCVNFVHYVAQKIAFSVCQKCSVTQKYIENAFWTGLCPGFRWGSSGRSPRSLSRPLPRLQPTLRLRRSDPRASRPILVPLRCFRVGYGPVLSTRRYHTTPVQLMCNNSAHTSYGCNQ